MKYRISPLWWPLFVALSPLFISILIIKWIKFKKNLIRAVNSNEKRIQSSRSINFPELDEVKLTVLVEEKALEGFQTEPGTSYLFQTNKGSLLFDIGFGDENGVLSKNFRDLGLTSDAVGAVAISHLHPDHMGGMKASRNKFINLPKVISLPNEKLCYLPARADVKGCDTEMVTKPRLLSAGIASTGPLARSLFFMGYTEEQVLIMRLKGKGLVIFTGCGHPTLPIILKMVQSLSPDPIYAIGGGFHMPITSSRLRFCGIHLQMILGTGLPPWKRLDENDLYDAIKAINNVNPRYVYLSAHDTCDDSLDVFKKRLKAKTKVLKAGATYNF